MGHAHRRAARPGRTAALQRRLSRSPAVNLCPDESMSVTPIVPTPAMVTPLSPLAQGAAVAIGGAFGSVLRWRLVVWLGALQWPIAPGILVANLVGGLLIGFSLVAFERLPSE